jgi:hypothetical protein
MFLFSILPILASPVNFRIPNLEILADTGSGSALVNQYISPHKKHFVSVPVTQITSTVFNGFAVSYYHEPTHLWKSVDTSGDSTLNTILAGYSVKTDTTDPESATLKFVGELNTGAFSIPLTRTWNAGSTPPDYDGWNLVGNPYPSATDWMSGEWSLNNVDPVVYFFDGNNYKPLNRNNQLGNGSQYIPAMQGFFVHVTSGSSGSLGVNNSARLHNNQPFYKSLPRMEDLLIMDATGDSLSDRIFIHFDSDATSGFDWQDDAYKLFGTEQSPQLYCELSDQQIASVNVLPYEGPNTVIPLSFKTGVAEAFELVASNMESFPSGTTIYLEDVKESFWQDLIGNPIYPFNYAIGDDPDRFLLHFNDPNPGLKKTPYSTEIQIYSYGYSVYIAAGSQKFFSGEVRIYDVTGRKLFGRILEKTNKACIPMNVVQGIYLISLITKSGIYDVKVYLGADTH